MADGDPTDPNDPAWGNALADIPCLYLCTYNLPDQSEGPYYYYLVGDTVGNTPVIDLPAAVDMFYAIHSTGESLDDIFLYTPTNDEFQALQSDPNFTGWYTTSDSEE